MSKRSPVAYCKRSLAYRWGYPIFLYIYMFFLFYKFLFFLSDFLEIQRKSFYLFLNNKLSEEFSNINPLMDSKICFLSKNFKFVKPNQTIEECVILGRTYCCHFYLPLKFQIKNIQKIKWIFLGTLPLLTRRGHFIVNGTPRILLNQIVRSPGIYFHQKNARIFYTEIIANRGPWIRIEIDSKKNFWISFPQSSKISLSVFFSDFCQKYLDHHFFLHEKKNLSSLLNLSSLKFTKIHYFEKEKIQYRKTFLYFILNELLKKFQKNYIIIPLGHSKKVFRKKKINNGVYDTWARKQPSTPVDTTTVPVPDLLSDIPILPRSARSTRRVLRAHKGAGTPRAVPPLAGIGDRGRAERDRTGIPSCLSNRPIGGKGRSSSRAVRVIHRHGLKGPLRLAYGTCPLPPVETGMERGRVRKRPMSAYLFLRKETQNTIDSDPMLAYHIKSLLSSNFDLSENGRLRLNKKLGISLKTRTLTPIDFLSICDILIQNSNLQIFDDIDNLKNRKLKTIGELLQNQFARGLQRFQKTFLKKELFTTREFKKKSRLIFTNMALPINSVLKEFFHSHQLSQYLDQSNPLSEITHKRRLSCLGSGGVNRDTAGMEIRGIHVTHYGRICPIETPEGKNAGLVNSLTAGVNINSQGFLETPFRQIYKQHLQNQKKVAFFSVENQEFKNVFFSHTLPKFKHISVSTLNFYTNNFQKQSLNSINLIVFHPQQFLSIATTCIPFIEHDDANRALMGSNMQRQALPLICLEKPFVTTLNAFRVFSDLKNIPTLTKSGFLLYVSQVKVSFLYTDKKISNIPLFLN